MILGYILISGTVGLIASVTGLFLGISVWLAFGLYALVGSFTLIFLPLSLSFIGSRASQNRGNPIEAGEGASPRETPVFQRAFATVRSMKILAVDDDLFILQLIPILSRQAGFTDITPVSSSLEALELLTNGDQRYDCILLDINMPRMNGIELCRHIRENADYRQTPIIMLTALRDVQNMGDAYRSGATDFVTKPFDIDELSDRLKLAQEAIHAQQKTEVEKSSSLTGYNQISTLKNHMNLHDDLRRKMKNTFVEQEALLSFLTQLPQKDVTNVQVLALRIDGMSATNTPSSAKAASALMESLASAAFNIFDKDKTIMTFADNATLLVATNSTTTQSAFIIENDIESRLQNSIFQPVSSDLVERPSVSVGGPLQLQGKKAERAKMVTHRALILVENRALDKQGRQFYSL